MRINLEDYLYQIDQTMAEKEDKEVYMLYVLVAATLIFLSYYFLWDSAHASFQKAHQKSTQLQQKITTDKQYLASHPESMIAQIENQTKALEAQFITYQDSNGYIKHQIEQISSLYYDEQAWGEYVDSISHNAKRFGIKLREYSNAFSNEQEESFGHVLDINVKAKGSFHNMMKYINSIEQSFLVVDIHSMDLKAEERLYSDFNISVWGITY